jgi:hypothetical protein
MTGLTRTTRELVLIHDLLLRDFTSLADINETLGQLSWMIMDDVELHDGKSYPLGLFLPYWSIDNLHVNAGPYSQTRKLYRILSEHLYGVYALGSIYTLKAVEFKRSGPFLLLSIDTRWKIGHW